MNKYIAFMEVIETASFTGAAAKLGYTQSAVSQMVAALEKELGTTLLERSRGGVGLTKDGRALFPSIRRICNSYMELCRKNGELHGLKNATVRIGTFTSVSCNWLPPLMKEFKEDYPGAGFELCQGEYTSIAQWI
jgi:DNA-binding transcriptional LysR family regulator